MDCAKVKEFLYRFIDNEADSTVIAHIERHLKDCPLCEKEINKEKKLDCLIREHFSKDEAPAHLREAIARRLQVKRQRQRYLLGLFILVVLIAIACIWFTLMRFS